MLVGRLPATRTWERADQDLLELFASEIAVAIRNAQLFARVEAQNTQLLELDAAKDDFLRGVSHNLQTPLTSIRAYADQLADDRPDRRLEIIAEQSERLSRMVRQLLTVTRLESGALQPEGRGRGAGAAREAAWEALGADGRRRSRRGHARDGWLAVADVDQLDQVLWALLDNAVKYGNGSPIVGRGRSRRAVARRLAAARITDGGRGVAEADRARLFGRFVAAARSPTGDRGQRRQRARAVRLARAVPGDGRRPGPGADGGRPGRGVQRLPAGRAATEG